MCVCVSIQPGDTVSAVRSYVTAPAGGAPPIRRIFDPCTTIVVLRIVLPFPSYAVLTFSTIGWSCAIASHGSRATAPTTTASGFMVRFPPLGALAARAAAVRPAVEKLGGKIERFRLSFGDYDIIGVIDMPN